MTPLSRDRRDFLKTTAAAGACVATGLVGPAARRASAATGDDLRVAVAGINSRGKAHLRGFSKVPGVRIAAVCDADSSILAKVGGEFEKKLGYAIDKEADFDALLARDDIDVISIATPNHWHALMAIRALDAGKHVYVEKPVCHNVWEGRQLVTAADDATTILGVGFQNRSIAAIARGVEYVQSGKLGPVRHVRVLCHKPRKGIGKSATPVAPPKSLAYDKWLGPADDEPIYRPSYHYDWHWDFNTGNGDLGNQAPHELDIARWFLGDPDHPVAVRSFGNRLGWDDAGESYNLHGATFDFAEGTRMVAEVRNVAKGPGSEKGGFGGKSGWNVEILVTCDGGTVKAARGFGAEVRDNTGNVLERFEGDSGDSVWGNFVDAVRADDGSLINSQILEGYRSSTLAHLANAAARVGKPVAGSDLTAGIADDELLTSLADRFNAQVEAMGIGRGGATWNWSGPYRFDPAAETFTAGDDLAAANALLKRTGRAGYEIPQLA